MKLFLASEAKAPQTFKKLQEFVGGFERKKVVYIPTGANGEGRGSWKDGGSWNLVQNLDAKITLIELEDYFSEEVISKICGQDIIWFAGGQAGYLMYWIRRTKLDKTLKKILEDGTIYVGSSAGAMITGKDMDLVEWYIGENEYGAGIIPGLGLVDFNIYPHYKDGLLGQIKKHFKGEKLYFLKDGEEVIVDGDKFEVVGEERMVSL